MKKAEIITKMEGQSDTSEFVLRTSEEEQKFLENHKQSVIDTEISAAHKKYDDDIFEVTGLRKKPTQKTYDFLKEILSTHNDKVKEFETQIATLKEQVKTPGSDKHLKEELASVQQQFKEFKDASETEKAQYQKTFQANQKRAEITKLLGEFKLKTMDEEVKKIFIDKIVDDLVATSDFRDEALVFLDKDQKILRNKNNALNPYSAKEILTEKLKNVLDTNHKVEGFDFDKAVEKDKDGKFKVNVTRPEGVKTKEGVSKWLVEQGGFKRNTPEYMAAYGELSKDLPLR